MSRRAVRSRSEVLARCSPNPAALAFPAPASPGADLRQTVERRLSGTVARFRCCPRARNLIRRCLHAADASAAAQRTPVAAATGASNARCCGTKVLTPLSACRTARRARSPGASQRSTDGSGAAAASAPATATRAAPPSSAATLTSEEPPRLHPLRLFYPGQTYKPEDLDVDAADAATFVHRPSQKTRQLHKRGQAANAELYQSADFRNGRLLSTFISESGKLLPRRTNKVRACLA